MLWKHYVYRQNTDVYNLWDSFFLGRDIKLLYISGNGFDTRGVSVLKSFIETIGNNNDYKFCEAKLLHIGFEDYDLSEDLISQTSQNKKQLHSLFSQIGIIQEVVLEKKKNEENTGNMLRSLINNMLEYIDNYTDIVLDISSLPRIVYIALITSILSKIVGDRKNTESLSSQKINFQVVVAENASLDTSIESADLRDELILIPGFSEILSSEAVQQWPLVWFPILGEKRTNQCEKIAKLANIPTDSEVCPILPHPSKSPRRADDLLIEYSDSLFEKYKIPFSSVLLVHESNPFEAYRQLLDAMQWYRKSLTILGGCRLLVTPLSSKLMTVAAGLASFEMRGSSIEDNYGVAIAYTEPKRYIANMEFLQEGKYDLSVMVLTGMAYEQ